MVDSRPVSPELGLTRTRPHPNSASPELGPDSFVTVIANVNEAIQPWLFTR